MYICKYKSVCNIYYTHTRFFQKVALLKNKFLLKEVKIIHRRFPWFKFKIRTK